MAEPIRKKRRTGANNEATRNPSNVQPSRKEVFDCLLLSRYLPLSAFWALSLTCRTAHQKIVTLFVGDDSGVRPRRVDREEALVDEVVRVDPHFKLAEFFAHHNGTLPTTQLPQSLDVTLQCAVQSCATPSLLNELLLSVDLNWLAQPESLVIASIVYRSSLSSVDFTKLVDLLPACKLQLLAERICYQYDAEDLPVLPLTENGDLDRGCRPVGEDRWLLDVIRREHAEIIVDRWRSQLEEDICFDAWFEQHLTMYRDEHK